MKAQWFHRLGVSLVSLSLGTGVGLAQDHALELSEGAVVIFPHDPVMNTTNRVTIEAWVQAGSGSTGSFYPFQRYQGNMEHKSVSVSAAGDVGFIYAGSPWPRGTSPTPSGVFPVDGFWHHVAFVRHQDGTYDFYVDGSSVVSGGPGPCWTTCDVINGTPETQVALALGSGWRIDDLRVSSVERYSGSFIPQTGYSPDADTAMLLDFDEGNGAVVNDSGPTSQVGSILGSYLWVSGYDGIEHYCFGNGSPIDCPCGNSSAAAAGCTNSTGYGAAISAWGSISVLSDDLVLTASPLPLYHAGLFYMGGAAMQAPMADGFQCVGAGAHGTYRFPPGNSGPYGALAVGPVVGLTNGLVNPGETWGFQAWYRDPAGPCGTGSNLSSAVTISFQP